MSNKELKKELIELAKAKGLATAEDAVEELAELAFEIVEKLVAHSENKYDDMIFAALKGKAKETLLEKIDGIDKSDNK